MAGANGRPYRHVHVHRPWAWCWWPATDLIRQDPDVTDARDPRTISTLDVDWPAVLQAVRYAVERCPVGPEALHLESVDVELPMPLRKIDYDMVASWVGAATPVTYWYEEDQIEDGRHRLWLTRPYADGKPIPLIANNLWYLDDALAGGPTTASFPDTLEDARLWWQNADNELRHANRDHRRQLANAYAELTAPEPIPAHWFDHLHDWDDALPRLAELHTAERTDRDLLAHVLPSAWRFRQDRHGLDPQLVIDMFRTLAGPAGFTMWGDPAPRPRGRLTLYRGATSANRCGPSWTTDPDLARHFASTRQAPGTTATVWTARIPADRLLAYFPDENEFIVDLTDAEDLIHPAPIHARPHRLTRWRTRRLHRLDDNRCWS